MFDRWFVKKDIESIINSYSQSDLGYDIGNRYVIRWESSTNKEDLDAPVLFLDRGEDQTRNIAKATLDYTKNGVLNDSRPYLPEHINEAINFQLAIDILNTRNKKDAANELYQNWLLSELEDNTGQVPDDHPVKRAVQKLELLKRGGFLGPVLFREYERLPAYGVPDSRIKQEADDFLEFLVSLAKKKGGRLEPIYFDEGFYHMAVILVGNRDYNFYVDKTISQLSEREVFHFLAVGSENKMEKIHEKLSDTPGIESCRLQKYELPKKTYLPSRDAIAIRVVSSVY